MKFEKAMMMFIKYRIHKFFTETCFISFHTTILQTLAMLPACTMSTRLDPWYICDNGTLVVTWPTEMVYPVDVKKVPISYSSVIAKQLQAPPAYKPEMVILSLSPP